MRRLLVRVALALCLANPAATEDLPADSIDISHAEHIGSWQGAPLYRTTLTSPTHSIDRIYRSMEGPITQTGFRLHPQTGVELLWLTGYEATIVDADAGTSLSQEFMCHSTVATNHRKFGRVMPSTLGHRDGRVFTLAQGQSVVRFPEGFGIPFLSNQRIELQAQVLNHNHVDANLVVRQRVSVEFVRDADLQKPIVPLALTGASGMKSLDEGSAYFGLSSHEADPELHGLGCSVGTSANEGHVVTDANGQRFTSHWIVKPGREENHTLVTRQLRLAYDTTLHYAAIHLHPYAESLALEDLTTGETVFLAEGRSANNRIALEEVAFVASAEGIPLYADHEYELFSIYDNPTGVEQDAMASAWLYVRVHDVALAQIRARAEQVKRGAPLRPPVRTPRADAGQPERHAH